MQSGKITRELDERHRLAQAAFEARDLSAYGALFTATLSYRQTDGRVIGRPALLRDVAAQFRGMASVHSAYRRESLGGDANQPTEVLLQTAMVEAVAFGVLRRRWRLERRAVYSWVKVGGVWAVAAVEVLEEKLQSEGWNIGLGGRRAR